MTNYFLRSCFISLLIIMSIGLSSAQDFYDIHSVKDIKLEFQEENWADILDSLKFDGNKERMIGTLKINGVRYDSVGVRYKGNSSYYSVRKSGSRKLPFNIKVNYTNKKQKLASGYSSIKLSNVFRDPSFVREALAYEIAREYMPASKCNYARLYINNELMGLYNNVESVDKKFILKNFGEKDGVFVKCDPMDIGGKTNAKSDGKNCDTGEYASLLYQGKDSICYEPNYELKSKTGWKELIQVANYLKNKPEKISEVLDVDMTLWMLAFNNVLVNLDSYNGKLSHNYYMYQDSLGIFHPILWDLNMAFGGFRYDGQGNKALSDEQMKNMSMFLHYQNDRRPLIKGLLSKSLYRKMYTHHVKTIISDYFSSGKYKSRAEALQRQIDFYVQSDAQKLYSYEDFKNNLKTSSLAGKSNMIGIYDLMDARAAKIAKHPLLSKVGPAIGTPSNKTERDSVIVSVKVQNTSSVYIFYKSAGGGRTYETKMLDDGLNGDVQKDDGTYSIKMRKSEISKYFIVAEHEKVVSILPKKSCMKYHLIP